MFGPVCKDKPNPKPKKITLQTQEQIENATWQLACALLISLIHHDSKKRKQVNSKTIGIGCCDDSITFRIPYLKSSSSLTQSATHPTHKRVTNNTGRPTRPISWLFVV